MHGGHGSHGGHGGHGQDRQKTEDRKRTARGQTRDRQRIDRTDLR